MLLEFRCSNFRSIKSPILFSMLVGQDTSHEDNWVEFDGHRILRSAVIYGANGSGKSNLVKAILFLKNLVMESISLQPGQLIRYQPHKKSLETEGCAFSIQFIKNKMRYSYGFTQKAEGIAEEHLFFYPKGRQVKIFTRDTRAFQEGDKFRGQFEQCRDVLKPNRLMLSCAANFSKVSEVQEAFAFFRDDLVIYHSSNQDNWLHYSLNVLKSSSRIKQKFLYILQELCPGIQDINIERKRIDRQSEALPISHKDDSNKVIVNTTEERYKVDVHYDAFDIPLQEESSGIQRLAEFLCPFIDIITNERTLICDELERNFHEAIVRKIVEWFCGEQKSASQLVFTTHDTSILSLDTFRRDQIWFTEMKEDMRETDLYSLAEIRGVRKDDNVAKGYVAGRYGAVPMLNIDFAEVLKGGLEK